MVLKTRGYKSKNGSENDSYDGSENKKLEKKNIKKFLMIKTLIVKYLKVK